MPDAFRIDPADNVAVALVPLSHGTKVRVGEEGTVLREDVPAGHKFALRTIPAGTAIVKYGMPIGLATGEISVGTWVHTHNLRTGLAGKIEYRREPSFASTLGVSAAVGDPPRFHGYRRPDGRVGTRNEIWIISTVGCAGRQAERLARLAGERLAVRVEGIHAFSHPYGCSQLGEDLGNTQRILANLARHPNAGGVLLLGLGCEDNQMPTMLGMLGGHDPDRIKSLLLQEAGDEIEEGLGLIASLAEKAGRAEREAIPAGELVLGLKCGGSDGLSGITANPLAGLVADRLIGCGGSCLLGEVPEMFGAETVLLRRAADGEVFARIAELIDDGKDYFLRHGQPIHENPSPGNKEGGITTLEEKSLGCIQKGGRSPVADVLRYGETARKRGLSLLQTPGNDLVSVTAMAAAGAQLVLFTTGRGTPVGSPVPVLKIASHSDLARRKSGWIDFDAGRMLAGESPDALADELMALALSVASGETRARNEVNDERMMAILKSGVTL